MPNTSVPAAGEAMPQPSYALTAAIHRYRGDWNLFLAQCAEADARGEDDNKVPRTFRASSLVIEEWERPAETLSEALMALECALADYDAGDTGRIPAMMKAALGWMAREQKQVAARSGEDISSTTSSLIDLQDQLARIRASVYLVDCALEGMSGGREERINALQAGVGNILDEIRSAENLLESVRTAST